MTELTRNEKLRECQAAIGYRFSNPKLLEVALTQPVRGAPGDSNERMEFLGDAVLG